MQVFNIVVVFVSMVGIVATDSGALYVLASEALADIIGSFALFGVCCPQVATPASSIASDTNTYAKQSGNHPVVADDMIVIWRFWGEPNDTCNARYDAQVRVEHMLEHCKMIVT